MSSLLREMIIYMPQGLTLGANRFFEPSKKFLNYMSAQFGNTLVYDVGAGDGYTAKRLNDLGVTTRAIDLSYRDGQKYPVEIANAVDYEYLSHSCVMFCRPCHGPWVECAIDQALSRGVTTFLYIGFRKNLRDDLGAYTKRFHNVLRMAGRDRESVWMMTK